MDAQEKITVITVCFNAAASIEGSIQSVLEQDYSNLEYIILDGQSTDGTWDIIQRYQDHITFVRSESDTGIYDAMNKAIGLSTGEILYFLNADDKLFDNHVLSDAAKEFVGNPAIDLLYGKLSPVNQDAKASTESLAHYTCEIASLSDFLHKGFNQQRVFFRKQVFSVIGPFNLAYSICADYDWMLRAIMHSLNIVFMDRLIASADCQGISHRRDRRRRIEKNLIVFRNLPFNQWLKYITTAIKLKFIKA